MHKLKATVSFFYDISESELSKERANEDTTYIYASAGNVAENIIPGLSSENVSNFTAEVEVINDSNSRSRNTIITDDKPYLSPIEQWHKDSERIIDDGFTEALFGCS